MAQLEVDQIHTAYGLSQVLFGVSLEMEAGTCVALVGSAGLRSGEGLRRAAQFAAGLLGGMYFGPSTGAVLSVVLVGFGLRDALTAENRALGAILVVAGFGLGLLVTYGVLMALLAPTDIRC